jgi:rod shape-determining protein MreC
MDTSREDVGISIRSAFLSKGTQQRFSLFALTVISILLIFLETIDAKPLNLIRSFVKDVIYRSAVVATYPTKIFSGSYSLIQGHFGLYRNYNDLKKENEELKNNRSESDFLEMENTQLRKLINEQIESESNLVSARVMLEEQSPYLNSFVINIGANKEIKNGMAVLDGKFFIGRIVDVNFFSSRILLVTDLNSKIPIISEPSGNHAILSGHGDSQPTLEYLSKNHQIKNGDKIYTSGKEGIFAPGISIGEAIRNKDKIEVQLYSKLNEITFVNINLEGIQDRK